MTENVQVEAARIDLAVDMGDVGVGEHPRHLADGVGLANVGEKRIAHSFALAGSADDACDVHEAHGRRQDALGAEDLREHVEPRVRHPDHADVRLDRGERVVRRQDVVTGESVEER